MIEVGLEFEGGTDRVVAGLLGLPASLRPVYFSHEDKPACEANRVDDSKRFAAFVAKSASGFFLLGPGISYSVRVAAGKPTICDCFLAVGPQDAEHFLRHMAQSMPIFGFACVPGERERRNRVITRHGANTVESWVGRDTRKYVPGLYWLTLLPEDLARKHGVPLLALRAAARQHSDLGRGQHLFRFYDRPEEWLDTSTVADLCAKLPGVFNIEEVKPLLATSNSFLEQNSLLRAWR